MIESDFELSDEGDCHLLIIGGSGLAGQALVNEARRRGIATIGISRRGDIKLDVCDAVALFGMLERLKPRVIINAAATVSLAICEAEPSMAWQINARLPFLLASYAKKNNCYLVQISTDHYYSGDGRRAHLESEPVSLVNEYSRTKFAAEAISNLYNDILVVRTNIIGLQSANGNSFGEWAADIILNDRPAQLFEDQFVSTLDVWTFAEALLDMANKRVVGIVNLASSEVFSKADIVTRIAEAINRRLTKIRVGTVVDQAVLRANSLGLDVTIAENILGRRLPNLDSVAQKFGKKLTDGQGI